MSVRRRVSSSDVAREAGVSRTTVSFVLNDTPGQRIPDATRQRVLDAAGRLGYRPSAEARMLRTGRSSVVLCLLPDSPLGGPAGELLERLGEHLTAAGYALLLHQRSAENDPIDTVLSSVTPAALLAFCNLSAEEVAQVEREQIPMAVWMGDVAGRADESGFTQRDIGRLQAETLIANGRERIGCVTTTDPRLAWFSVPRLRGAADACAAAGLEPPVEVAWAIDREDVDVSWLSEWVDAGVTGVCAFNDEYALVLMSRARTVGIAVPTDLAVVGVDDIDLARAVVPPLTTVGFDVGPAGEYLGRRLVGLAEGRHVDPPSTPLAYVVKRGTH